MNLNNFCCWSSSCLVFLALINTIVCHESNTAKYTTLMSSSPFVIPLPSHYRTQNQDKEIINALLSSTPEEKLKTYQLLEPLERLRRASSYLPYETLSATPSRRSASHPCRWKLCGAHFGYHSMRRF